MIIIAFFLFGLVFGSFLNVCIYRMPRELSVVAPRSACPACGKPIAAYDNIPVLSWLILRGRCRHCHARISPRYAIVELLTGIFFVLCYLIGPFVLTYLQQGFPFGMFPEIERVTVAVKYCILSFLLIGLIFTDAETKILPDLLTKPGIALGLVSSLFVPVEAAPFLNHWGDFDWHVLSFINSVVGAVFGAGFIFGASLLYQALRGREGMGMGDVKLMALIGAFLGLKLTLLVLLLGSLIGSVSGVGLMLMVWRKRIVRRREHSNKPPGAIRARAWQSAQLIFRNFEIPFGVFLGAAAFLAAFVGMPLIHWYLGLYQ